VSAEAALAAADMHDRQRRGRAAASRFAGVPIALKDNMDVAGTVICGFPGPRRRTAGHSGRVIVARLRQAGFVPVAAPR